MLQAEEFELYCKQLFCKFHWFLLTMQLVMQYKVGHELDS